MYNPDVGKVNNTSVNVIYTMMTLLQSSKSMNEIINKFCDEKVFNNFVISKYINTCRYCGVDIRKINGEYHLLKLPFTLNFNSKEYLIFKELINVAENSLSNELKKHISELFFKLSRFTQFDLNLQISEQQNSLISVFEEALYSEMMIVVVLKNGEELICAPYDFNLTKNKIYISVFSNSEIKNIPLKEVKTILHYPKKIQTGLVPPSVVYKLSNDLAKRYSLRPNEKIVNIETNKSIVISNRFEDKTELLKRLMRYDHDCEILSPHSYREDMKTLIASTLANYNL